MTMNEHDSLNYFSNFRLGLFGKFGHNLELQDKSNVKAEYIANLLMQVANINKHPTLVSTY